MANLPAHCYISPVAATNTLDTLMERAASWPDEAQAELVRFMIDTEAKHFGVYRLSEEEHTAIKKNTRPSKRALMTFSPAVSLATRKSPNCLRATAARHEGSFFRIGRYQPS